MKVFFFIFLALLPLNTYANDKTSWTWTDTGLQAAFLTLGIMDYSQTLHIARNRNIYWEYWDDLFGERPTTARVHRIFIPYLVGHTVVAYLLPKPYRTFWQAGFIAFELNNVRHNHEIGIKISLPF